MTVLEINACRAIRLRRELHFDFARHRKVRFETPLVCDLPGEDQAPRRIPRCHLAPGTIGAVSLLAVEASAHEGLNHASRHRRLANVMCAGPPRVETFCEHAEGVLDSGLDGHTAPDGR